MNLAYDLFLLMFNLSQLRSKENIIKLFTDSITEAFKPNIVGFVSNIEYPDQLDFEIKTGNSFYGFISLEPDNTLSQEQIILLKNAVQMLALILNHLDFDLAIEKERDTFEKVAEERLGELQKSFSDLEKTKAEALILIGELSEEIEKRKMAEESLRKTEKYFRLLIEKAPDGVVLVDQFGNMTYASPSARRIFGYLDEKAPLPDPNQSTHPEDLPMVLSVISETIKNPALVPTVEYRFKSSENEWRWVESTFSNQYADKAISALVINFRDVTERKKAEESLRESEKRFRELNSTKDKFFSIIAHDLKSPFNAILGFSSMLLQEARTLDIEEIENYASMINTSASQTMQLLENLLEWARLQQGRHISQPRKLLLHEVTEEVLSLIDDHARLKKIYVKNLISENSIVFMDENILKSIIRNLVGNAIKFSKHGGMVKISAKNLLNKTQVSVTDNGIGICKENIDKLFDVSSNFTTRGTNNEKGTGLGLALCKEFIQKHGGEIWVESEEGKGSTFSFTIPERK